VVKGHCPNQALLPLQIAIAKVGEGGKLPVTPKENSWLELTQDTLSKIWVKSYPTDTPGNTPV